MTTHHPIDPTRPAAMTPPTEPVVAEPTLAEEVLQLLFQPANGTIAGEGTLFYVLGGAVLVELAMADLVVTEGTGLTGTIVRAAGETPPADALLRATWEYLLPKPRGAQTVLAATGPTLRAPVLDRLVERGEIVRERGRVLGILPTEKLTDGGTGRRDELIAQLRAVLVDGATPTPRIAAAGALVAASGALPWFDREIPWGTTVAERAEELQRGEWGAGAAAAAVTRTMIAIAVNATIASTIAASR